ncbi:MAG TPA: DUF4157 domain-containing protein [Bryobacteraceae bacterium]|jgi:hypothetical protein
MFASVETKKSPAPAANHTLARNCVRDAAPPSGIGNQAALRGVPSVVNRVLNSPGQPLDRSERAFFEPRFGRDFAKVRVHTGSLASASAQAVSARAYAVGSHVVFGSQEYSPGTATGRRLLAHELSHVVQSGGQPATPPTRISEPGDVLEAAAERHAENVLSPSPGRGAMPSPASPATLHRYAVPMSTECKDAASWMDKNSPYKPEWAQTACTYSFNGNLDTTPPRKTGGGVSITARGNNKVSVSVNCPTDLPEWGMGKGPKTQLAWMKMIRVLDAHEGRHRKIGQDWRAKLDQRFKTTNVSATGTDEADARTNLGQKLAESQQKSQDEAQAAQSKIDPFRDAHLVCPDEQPDPGLGPQPDKIPSDPAPAEPAKLDEGNAPAQPKALSPDLQKLFPNDN